MKKTTSELPGKIIHIDTAYTGRAPMALLDSGQVYVLDDMNNQWKEIGNGNPRTI